MAHRSRRRHRSPFVGDPNGINKGDDIGNRRPKSTPPPPPDDIGNRKEKSSGLERLPDDLGNRVDAPPTHEASGILNEIAGPRRRKKRSTPLVRVGRYFAGGINPLVSTTTGRAQKASEEAFERHKQEQRDRRDHDGERDYEAPNQDAPMDVDGEEGGRKRRRRKGSEEGASNDINARRARRFFDFNDDDRFDYKLKSTVESKRAEAQFAVSSVLEGAERKATVLALLLEDGDRPKVLVTIHEAGPATSVPKERQADDAGEPLFVLGNAALMSLNYLTNKIVNRYPDDRIRLAILPKDNASEYLSAFEEHLKSARPDDADAAAPSIAAARAALEGKPVKSKAARPATSADADEAPAAEKAPAKKKATAKKATAKKTAAKKTAAASETEDSDDVDTPKKVAKKTVTKKKTTTKKAAAKKVAVKKAEVDSDAEEPVAKKAPAKKAAAKKATAKKAATKKAPAKKATAKKATAKKAPAKKTATKKAAAKKKTVAKKAADAE